MRGLSTLFWGRNIPTNDLTNLLVVCSSDELNFPRILQSIRNHFSHCHLSYVIIDAWRHFLPDDAKIVSIKEIKSSPFSSLFKQRSRKYDATVLILSGRPVFTKIKWWSIFTNYRCLFIWNENLDFFSCCANNRKILFGHLKWRLREKGIVSFKYVFLSIFLSPFGFLYLLFFCWLLKFNSRILYKINHKTSQI